jgi:hypothetical protein
MVKGRRIWRIEKLFEGVDKESGAEGTNNS